LRRTVREETKADEEEKFSNEPLEVIEKTNITGKHFADWSATTEEHFYV
jgi:hypothetical protein